MTNDQRRLRAVWALCLVAALRASGQTPAVKLVDQPDAWRLANGVVELVVDKRLAKVTHFAFADGPKLVDEGGYCDTVARENTTQRRGAYSRLGHHVPVIAEVCHQSAGRADVMLRTDPARYDPSHPLQLPLWYELHYVLRRGDAGFYVYWLLSHRPNMQKVWLEQTRYVLRCARLFDRWQVADGNRGPFEPWTEFEKAPIVSDAVCRMPDGRFITKYSHAWPIADHAAFGLYSSTRRLGIWCISASREYFNGGPTKQELNVQQAKAGPLLQMVPHSGHFAGPGTRLEIEGDWAKVYGPVLFYANQGGTQEELWQDAKSRAREETAHWPYRWVAPRTRSATYPIGRGTVRGRVERADGRSPQGAWAVLAAPEPDWQVQGRGYIFWDDVGDDGMFEIRHVRAGRYTLYVFQPGVYGEARRDGIGVKAGDERSIGAVTLRPVAHGERLWQIGAPDRTAREFRNGSDYRRFRLLDRYPKDFPNGVNFVTGSSREARDWNHCQPGNRTWQVTFRMDRPLAGRGFLTVAAADSSYHPPARIEVAVNDRAVGELTLAPGDSAAHRLGIYGRYQVKALAFPAANLRRGDNVISLKLPRRLMWVMYDFVRLEAVD